MKIQSILVEAQAGPCLAKSIIYLDHRALLCRPHRPKYAGKELAICSVPEDAPPTCGIARVHTANKQGTRVALYLQPANAREADSTSSIFVPCQAGRQPTLTSKRAFSEQVFTSTMSDRTSHLKHLAFSSAVLRCQCVKCGVSFSRCLMHTTCSISFPSKSLQTRTTSYNSPN